MPLSWESYLRVENSGQLRGQWEGHWVTAEALKGKGIWQDPVDTENQSG